MSSLWFVTGASLFATWLNVHRRRACFLIWAVTNAIWAGVDWSKGIPQQAVLHIAYLGLALYGLALWRTNLSQGEPDGHEAPE